MLVRAVISYGRKFNLHCLDNTYNALHVGVRKNTNLYCKFTKTILIYISAQMIKHRAFKKEYV